MYVNMTIYFDDIGKYNNRSARQVEINQEIEKKKFR